METVNIELVVLCLVIGYGLILGISNSFHRLTYILGFSKGYCQSTLGQILDMVWISCIIWLSAVNGYIAIGEFV